MQRKNGGKDILQKISTASSLFLIEICEERVRAKYLTSNAINIISCQEKVQIHSFYNRNSFATFLDSH